MKIKTKFRTLVYAGRYVDVNRLNAGLYACEKPFLYSEEETIDKLKERAELFRGMEFINEEYFTNLKMCEMRDITVEVNDTPRKFEPITLNIEIPTEAELCDLWLRLNLPGETIDDKTGEGDKLKYKSSNSCTYYLWEELNNYVEKFNLKINQIYE